ncbi:MAG TPA: bifunctional diaminohydroxyphosphoribosylaminopyrimidine deaminase/5-amino-6-(5-phosphoribosylamino)uracil reductase RibD [Fibrobacteria bacterium]|nr:bifunctional diaminohydroxyphosphoribosylaminopyrimidine deaminase/5-amino-6-(5-phosphoribosylamino)uracil reductase RibD [Fibrobacteria bacterium]
MDPKIASKWMEDAFALATEARGTTLPNPAVGCIVLDKAGKPVAKAATSKDGRPHAERKALDLAGSKASGGTLVVTLEPCVAFPGKKSPPCAAAAILSGIETVIVGTSDPNPHVAGRGIHALRKAGMKVVECPLEDRVPDFYAGFGRFLATGTPRVTVKIAVSSDGNVAAKPGQRTAITGAESRRFVHSLRSRSDAILVGGRTVLVDDPKLTVRDVAGRSPHRLVLWPSAGLPDTAQIWTNSARTTAFGIQERPAKLPSSVDWVRLPADGDHVDLAALVAWCGKQGMHDLLVEPGPTLLQSILAKEIWDDLWVLRSDAPLAGGVPADPRHLLPKETPQASRTLGPDQGRFWRQPNRLIPIPPLS